MSVEIGDTFKAKIQSHSIREIGDKEAVIFVLESPGGDFGQAAVWISEKAMGMARKQLRLAGFDVDKHELSILAEDRTFLAGNFVPIVVDEYKEKPQWRIDMDNVPPKGKLSKLTAALRAAKQDGETPVEEPLPF